jgi:hypothetical protein
MLELANQPYQFLFAVPWLLIMETINAVDDFTTCHPMRSVAGWIWSRPLSHYRREHRIP